MAAGRRWGAAVICGVEKVLGVCCCDVVGFSYGWFMGWDGSRGEGGMDSGGGVFY